MHMADARLVALCEARRIVAAPGGVAGIEQQVNGLRRCRAMKAVDFGVGLDHGAHVVVIGERQPSAREQFGELGEARA